MKRYVPALALALALTGSGAVAHAQHEATEEATPGFHQPAPMNLFNISPPVEMEHGHEVKGPPPFVLGPLVNFAILVLLGYMAVRRSINPALAARKVAMETEITEAKRLQTEAQALHREFTDRLARLDRELDAIKSEFVRVGETERDRIIAEARDRAERLRAEGAQALDQALQNLRDELRQEAVVAAAGAAEAAIRRTITAADQQRLADDYLQNLDAQPVAPDGREGARA